MSVYGGAPVRAAGGGGIGGFGSPIRAGSSAGKSPIGFPLSSQFTAGQRGLYSDYQNAVAGANAKLQQLPYFANVGLGRINQDNAEARGHANEDFANRGIYNSGLRLQQLGRIDNQFNRERQDQGFDYARQVAALQGDISGAGAAYNRGLMDLYLQSANTLANDPSLPFYAGQTAQRKPVKVGWSGGH